MLIPKEGTLERAFLVRLIEKMDDDDPKVDYRDFEGTGITIDNIDQIAENLRNGMFEAENDSELGLDA